MERKITNTLLEWKKDPEKKALVIIGARQIGKTYIINEFGEKYYDYHLHLDFSKMPGAFEIFKGNIDSNSILERINLYYPQFKAVRGKSLLFLDEIHLCPAARSSVKSLSSDGRVDVITSGSLLGVKGLKRKKGEKWGPLLDDDFEIVMRAEYSKSVVPDVDMEKIVRQSMEDGRNTILPTGYESIHEMLPMDFEEYLWAIGISHEQTRKIREHIHEREPFDEGTLTALNYYFSRYVLTGGMPEAVKMSLLENEADQRMLSAQGDIVVNYLGDINKYAPKGIIVETNRVYTSIPSHLNRTNRRFRFVDIEGKENKGMREYADPIYWLETAGMVIICDCLNEPVMPLECNVGKSFKLYMNDSGLLCSQIDRGSRIAIAEGRNDVNKGGIMENVIACMIVSSGLEPYYFERNKPTDNGVDRIEIDFIVNFGGGLAAIEVKSGKNRRSSSLKKLKNDERYSMYSISRFIKLGTTNIMVDDEGIEHYPLFAAAFMDSMYDLKNIEYRKGLKLNL